MNKNKTKIKLKICLFVFILLITWSDYFRIIFQWLLKYLTLFVHRKYLTGASTVVSLLWKTISFVITTFGLWPAVQTFDFIIVISEASTPYFRLRIIMFSVFFLHQIMLSC